MPTLGEVLAGAQPWADDARAARAGKSNAAPRTAVLTELIAQPPDADAVWRALALPEHELLDEAHAPMRENISALVREALAAWAAGGPASTHALALLTLLVHAVLAKPLPNYTLDAVAVLVGGMEDADDVFGALVATLDTSLRTPGALQRGALRLALVAVACAGNSPLITYFLHRDLLGAALRVAETAPDGARAADAALLISLLATCNAQAPASAPVAVLAPDAAAAALARAAAFQPYLRALREHAAAAALGELVPALGAAARAVRDAYAPAAEPPARAAVLLPLWLFCHVSTPFADALARAPALVTLLSLASHMLTHASASARSAAYAHLALQLLAALLATEPLCAALLTDDVHAEDAARDRGVRSAGVRIDHVAPCRDRANAPGTHARAGPKRPRRLLVAVLDCAAAYARFNLTRRLDVRTHIAALGVVRAALGACVLRGVRLEYAWMPLWQALLNTAAFVAARGDALAPRTDIDALARALLDTLTDALATSDAVLQTPAETTLLVYELARAGDALRGLAARLGAHADTPLLALLAAVDARLDEWRAARARSSLIARVLGAQPPSPADVMHVIQGIALDAVLGTPAPAPAPARTTREIPPLGGAILRVVRADVLRLT